MKALTRSDGLKLEETTQSGAETCIQKDGGVLIIEKLDELSKVFHGLNRRN